MPDAKILIVEDENIVALDLKRRLNKLNYNVIGMAPSATKAIALVDEYQPDIVLMDIHIQGNTDGIDIAKILCDQYQIPVIFLTAYSEDSTLLRAKESKPYGYLIKPYSERELHACIQVALEKSKADKSLRDTKVHLQLALDAGNLSTWEAHAKTADVIVSYAPDGSKNKIADWQQISEKIVLADKERVLAEILKIQRAPELSIELSFEINDPSDGHCWLAMYGKSFQTDFGIKVVGVLKDETERRVAEQSLKQAALVYECSADGIVILDNDKCVLSCNSAFARITGRAETEMLGASLTLLSAEVIGEDTRRDLQAGLANNGYWQGEVKTFRANHEFLYAWVNVSQIPEAISSFGQYVAIVSDITEIRATQEKLSRIAYYDSLTSLPNRNLFMDRLTIAVENAKRHETELAILFLDLDHFKLVNDTLGHQTGDVLLKTVAKRLRTQIRAVDTLCRIGGDEFIVIIDRFKTKSDLSFIASKLLETLKHPVRLLGTEIIPEASIGISVYPKDADNKDDLIKMADTAMYSAKNEGRNRFAFYHQELTEKSERYLKRETELRQAIAAQQFIVHYQPQYNVANKEVIGLEALIRWEHPELGFVAAGEVIPVAEASDLIIEIGNWVVQEVCRQINAWREAGLRLIPVAINVSPRQLQDINFVKTIVTAMQQHQIPAELLEIEITESCLQDAEQTINNLIELEKLGLTIAIDDFGTGYSCFSSLKSLPIGRLKIDKTFVNDVSHNEASRAIVSAIVAMSQKLNLQVIAEGIETQSQFDFMETIECQAIQGFYFARPMSAQNIESLLRAGEASLGLG